MSGPTADLARWCAELHLDDLSDVAVERLGILLLDHLGVARLGATRPHHRTWADVELAMGAGGRCRVLGQERRTSVDRAAFLNGVAGSSGPNLDDVWHGSLGHPGVGTWPAALAVGELVDADGCALLEAGAVGYEVAMRIGTAVGRSAFERGWHPRGGCNTAAAAVAALKVQGERDPAVYAAAIGLAANAAAGVVGAAYFSDAWYALSGHASREGVLAAAAARAGLSATEEPLDGPRGYLAATSGEPDPNALIDGLGSAAPLLLQAGQKLYPSSGATHAALESAVSALRALGVDADDVASVRIDGFREMADVLGQPFPANGLAATMSTPYVVACGLTEGTFALRHLDDRYRGDVRLTNLQTDIALHVDARLDTLPPAHLGARTTITTTDGRTATVEVLSASGHPGNPLSRDQVLVKLRDLHRDGDLHDGPDLTGLADTCGDLTRGTVAGVLDAAHGTA